MTRSRISTRRRGIAIAVVLAVVLTARGAHAQTDSDASVDALATQLKGGGVGLSRLQLSGFADFNYVKYNFSKASGMAGMFGKDPAFWIGNLNLYLDATLSERARSLIEVRFTYLPHGGYSVGSDGTLTRTNDSVPDYTDLNRSVNVGGVVIERAWVEYRLADYFTLRGGHYLTPYGIWNVDHGSPVIIGVLRPFVIGQQLIPESQSGLEGYGTVHLGPSSQIGYHLTLSNGRVGNRAEYLSVNGRPGLGGRVFFESNAWGELRAGASGYTGQVTNDNWVYGTSGNVRTITQRRQEWSAGADVHWDFKDVVVNAEYLINSMHYEVGNPVHLDGRPLKNERRWGYYVLAGWRLPILRVVMPYGMYEFFRASQELHDEGFSTDFVNYPSGVLDLAKYTVGVNVHVQPNLVVKAQYGWVKYSGPNIAHRGDDSSELFLQTAWAF